MNNDNAIELFDELDVDGAANCHHPMTDTADAIELFDELDVDGAASCHHPETS